MSNEVAEQAKLKWTEQIDESLQRGDYGNAKLLSQKALSEFPNDPDLLAREERAIQGRERSAQAHQFLDEAIQLCADQSYEEGIQILRGAYALDERSPAIRSALVNGLVGYARSILTSNRLL